MSRIRSRSGITIAMKTTLSSATRELRVSHDSPIVLIGEKINPTGRKLLPQALLDGNYDYVEKLAIEQTQNGADVLDVNVGAPGIDEVQVLPEIVKLVAGVSNLPLCIDTSNMDALAAALEVAPGKPLVNSVTGESESLKNILPLVKDRGAAVIGLTIDDDGISTNPEVRFATAEKIVDRAVQLGIPAEDVFIDPLVMTVGSDNRAGVDALESIRLVKEKLGSNIAIGASNISFGMPDRYTINQAFMTLAIQAGANCMITDPGRLGLTIRATELLLSNDAYGRHYLTFYRNLEKQRAA